MSDYPIGSTAEIFYDADGNPCTLRQLIVSDPDWAASRINHERRELRQMEAKLAAFEPLTAPSEEAQKVFAVVLENNPDADMRAVPNQWVLKERARTQEIGQIADDLEAKLAAVESGLKKVSDYNARLEHKLAAAEPDAGRLDWLEEKPYWVTVQTQPSGEFIHSGSGHGIRAAIDTARGAE